MSNETQLAYYLEGAVIRNKIHLRTKAGIRIVDSLPPLKQAKGARRGSRTARIHAHIAQM